MYSLFVDLDEGDLSKLSEQSDEIRISAGKLFVGAGNKIDHVCLVLEGRLASLFQRDWGEDRILQEFKAGDLIGEAEFLEGEICQLDIRALEDSRILQLPKEFFEYLLVQHSGLRQWVTESARAKTCLLLVTRYLNKLFSIKKMEFSDPLLQLKAEEEWLSFERDILQQLEERSEWIRLKRGEYLFHQADAPDYAYVLASGTVGIYLSEADSGEYELNRVKQGEMLGEVALVSNRKRSASVLALRDCELFRISPKILNRMAEKYPRIMLSVYQTITDRIQNTLNDNSSRSKRPTTAILSATSELDLDDFSAKLIKEISMHGAVACLTSQSVDQSLGKIGIANSNANDPTNLRLARWLNAHESRFDHIVYQADAGWTDWTQRCIRQADHVIIVADATNEPHFPEIQFKLTEEWQHWSLVLLHPADTVRPMNTSSWLEGASADYVYHVRRGNKQDIARLARILSGRAVSLVLSGGGARGAAHLGVLRALEELGIEVDMVGGTSIGARVAGYVAQGLSAAECFKASRHATRKSLVDFTLPLTSVASGKRLANSIKTDMGSWDIEDFWIPFFCVSTDLISGRLVVHRRGNSARAIRASVSVPGLMPPVTGGNELLVDGGVLNNLPIGVMREANPDGQIIAIDLSIPNALDVSYDYGQSLSGWKQLLSVLNPFAKKKSVPAISEVIVQSMLLGSNLRQRQVPQKEHADFYHKINVEGVRLFQFSEMEKTEKQGYEQTVQPLKNWVEENKNNQ